MSTAGSSTAQSSTLPPSTAATDATGTTTATATATSAATPRRPPRLPAVKGTMGGIETPKRDIWSPGLRSSAPPSPTGTTGTTELPVTTTHADPNALGAAADPASTAVPPAELAFRADPRMRTCFESLPEGGEEVMRLFGV